MDILPKNSTEMWSTKIKEEHDEQGVSWLDHPNSKY